jgi:dTMP kinase
MSKLIVFEGIDGSGKTTQAKLLYEALVAADVRCIITREPGGTALGSLLRDEIVEAGGMSPNTELLMFAADRAYHMEKIIKPALDDGIVVICDRYVHSTIAYQGSINGINQELLTAVTKDVYPADLTFYMRREHTHIKNPSDAIESRGLYYYMSVIKAYDRLWKSDYMNMRKIEAGDSIRSIHDTVKLIYLCTVGLHAKSA